MSWFNAETLHYSLNRAQESGAAETAGFPQLPLLPERASKERSQMPESDQGFNDSLKLARPARG
jgi:hypothetical protein